jgi:hypothetical protein
MIHFYVIFPSIAGKDVWRNSKPCSDISEIKEKETAQVKAHGNRHKSHPKLMSISSGGHGLCKCPPSSVAAFQCPTQLCFLSSLLKYWETPHPKRGEPTLGT